MSAELDIINRVLTLFNQENVTSLEETSFEISQYQSVLRTKHFEHQTMNNMWTNVEILTVQKDVDTGEYPLPVDVIEVMTHGFTIKNNKLIETDEIPVYGYEKYSAVLPYDSSFYLPYKLSKIYNTLRVLVRRLTPLDSVSESYKELMACAVALENYGITRDLSRFDLYKKMYDEALRRVFEEELRFRNSNITQLKRRGRVV